MTKFSPQTVRALGLVVLSKCDWKTNKRPNKRCRQELSVDKVFLINNQIQLVIVFAAH